MNQNKWEVTAVCKETGQTQYYPKVLGFTMVQNNTYEDLWEDDNPQKIGRYLTHTETSLDGKVLPDDLGTILYIKDKKTIMKRIFDFFFKIN